MQIGNVSPKSVASAVWSQSTRSLSSLGSALSLSVVIGGVVAASTNVFITPAASLGVVGVILGTSGATNFLDIGVTDGTSFFKILAIAASNRGAVPSVVMSNSISGQVSNEDAANAASYSVSYFALG